MGRGQERGLYGFFSQAFSGARASSSWRALISDEGTANLREIFPDAAYRQELAQVRLDAREGRLTLEEAVLDFEALFRIPGARYLSPYESVYRPQGAGGRGGLCGAGDRGRGAALPAGRSGAQHRGHGASRPRGGGAGVHGLSLP